MIDAAQQLLVYGRGGTPSTIATAPPAGRYRPILRAIGAYLDSRHARYPTIAEVQEGFLVHYFTVALTRPAYATITHAALEAFVESITAHRISLHPPPVVESKPRFFRRAPPVAVRYSSGYEEVMRVFAQRFDRDDVRTITLTEGDYGWLLSSVLPVPAYIQADPKRMHHTNYFHESVISHADLTTWSWTVRQERKIVY